MILIAIQRKRTKITEKQTCAASQVKVMTLTLFPIKKGQNHDLDFYYSKNKSQSQVIDFFQSQ